MLSEYNNVIDLEEALSQCQDPELLSHILNHHKGLSKKLVQHLPSLIVKRGTKEANSHMFVEKFLDEVKAKTPYRLEQDGTLVQIDTKDDFNSLTRNKEIKQPNHVEFYAEWDKEETDFSDTGNILGGYGRLLLSTDHLNVPTVEATVETLNYYGATLIKVGETVYFEDNHNVAYFQMEMGENYVKDYIMNEQQGGGGNYLEYHDRPHFHMPLNEESRGYYLLGKQLEDNKYHMSFFRIPFGYAVYTGLDCLHNDSYLIGPYNVVFNVAEHYSTVIFREKSKKTLVSLSPMK